MVARSGFEGLQRMFNRITSVGVLAIAIATGMSASPAAAGRSHRHHHHKTSFTDQHHRGHHEEPTHVRATPEPESSTPAAPAVVAPPPHHEETTHHTSKVAPLDKETEQARQKATSLFIDAKPNISLKLNAHFQYLTKQEIEEIIRSEFRKAAENTAKQLDSGVSFEIARGKLKIGASKTIAGVNVTFGELNVYKTSAVIASSIIAACKAFVSNELRKCLNSVLSKAESTVTNDFTPESNLQARDMHETRTPEASTSAWLVYAVVAAIAAGIVGFIGLFFKKHQSEEGAA